MRNRKYRNVIISPERLEKYEANIDDIIGFAIVNSSLNSFRFKEIFPWNLMITLNSIEVDDNLLPTENEMTNIHKFRKKLEREFNFDENPNSLFLANVCANGSCDLTLRIHKPDFVNDYLQEIIKNKSSKYEFGYIMTEDKEWLEVEALIDL
jgi:hypothetical protein